MTPAGHFHIGLFIFMALPYPLNIILIFISHFFADKFPEYYSLDLKKEWKAQLLYGLGVVISLIGGFLVGFYLIGIPIHMLVVILLSACAIDVLEGIYLGIKKVFNKKSWPTRFFMCHNGIFPFKRTPWPIILQGRPNLCFSRIESIIYEFLILIIVIIVFLII